MDAEAVRELFREFGPVDVRRMFGGQGIFVDGMMMGLIAGGVIYLKVDAETVARFDREELPPFSYMTGKGRKVMTNYRKLADRLYDDPDELVDWARDAEGVARRAAARRRSPAKRNPAKKSPAKKSPAERSPAKRNPAKKGAAKGSPAEQREAKPATAKARKPASAKAKAVRRPAGRPTASPRGRSRK